MENYFLLQIRLREGGGALTVFGLRILRVHDLGLGCFSFFFFFGGGGGRVSKFIPALPFRAEG